MRGLCATSYGQTPTTGQAGVFPQEALAIHLDRIFQNNLIM
jgi:hypothetical protein